MILPLLATSADVGATVIDPEVETVPYLVGRAPYNAPVPMVTPTTTSSGCVVHPSVLDFGDDGWNGWRYWLLVSEYGPGGVKEDPWIFHSQDGFNWSLPTGVTSAIWSITNQTPEGSAFLVTQNKDPELVHDPATGHIFAFWAASGTVGGVAATHVYRSSSADGSTWSTPQLSFELVGGGVHPYSPSIVRGHDGLWRIFVWANSPRVSTIASLTEQWPPFTTVTSGHGTPWHAGVWCDPITGRYWMAGSGHPRIWAASSWDGVTWTTGATVLTARADDWDDAEMYRPTIQPHPDGTHMRLWYSCRSTALNWRSGYTTVPRTLWP